MKKILIWIGIVVFIGVTTAIVSIALKKFMPELRAEYFSGWLGGTLFMLFYPMLKD